MIAPRELFEGHPPKFREGQLVRHVRYGYRGAIVALDRQCEASETWYQANQTQPDRDQPWYHVLVDGATHSTYVAESNLTEDTEGECIVHPWVNLYFDEFTGKEYHRSETAWPHEAP